DRVMLYKSGINRIVNAPLIFNGRCFGSLNAGVVDSASVDLFYAALVQSVANWIAPALAAFSSAGAVAEDVEEARARTSQAQSESAMKSSFIANVSHEIRTPLNAMIGMAQILGNDDLTDAQAEKVSVILQSGQSLITTLNDILDLSKIEAGKLSLTLLRNHPAECFPRAVNLWRDRAAQKGLTLALTLADGLPDTLVYDADRVQQCLSNLLSNAIKFSEHGVIDVRVSAAPIGDAVMIHVDVEDRGCGIASQSLATIFEPFEQVGPARAAEETGTGLGLAICRRLARMMDGDVTVQSSVGQGSTFTLGFQAGRAPAVDGAIDEASGQATLIPPTELLRGRKLLLVEDVATNRVVVKLLLKKYALEVTEAENGRDALDCLGRESFDLVLLDMQMPVMDGAETIRHIRASDQPFQTVPVIALTASAMVGDRERFLRMGIDGYIPKPVDESSLVSEIGDILCRTAS
ncbi:MAG: ATP-binding protein, partial [Pseudomonadota bacterium]